MGFAYEMNKYAPIVARENVQMEPGEIVGVISHKQRGVVWVVSPYREDKQHGATFVSPMTDYCKSMLRAVTIR